MGDISELKRVRLEKEELMQSLPCLSNWQALPHIAFRSLLNWDSFRFRYTILGT